MTPTPLKRIARLTTEVVDDCPRPLVALEYLESGTGKLLADTQLVNVAPGPGVATVAVGDVLFGKLRPYLAKSWVADRPTLASTELLCLRPQRDIDSRWLGYVVASSPLIEWAVATSDGTKMPRTSWEKLGEFRFVVPSAESQRAIADYLDRETARIDALIAAKQRMMELLEERWQAILEETIQALEKQFSETPLKYICRDVVVGIVITPSAWYADTGVPAIRGTNVSPGAISLEDLVYLTPEGHGLHPKSQLRSGDVVVVRTGQAGAAAVVPPELEGANCIDLVIVRLSKDYSPQFLEYVLNSDWMQKHIDEHSVGTIQSHFNVGAASAVPVPRAPRAEQDATVKALGTEHAQVCDVTERLNRQITLLQERRRALITVAVTGQIDIPEAA